MGTNKISVVWKSSDGSEHESKAAANDHELLLAAANEFEVAAEKVLRCIGAAARTADGEPFLSRGWKSYWHIAGRHDGGLPQLVKLEIWSQGVVLDIGEYDPCVKVRIHDEHVQKYRTYRIDSLYADKRAAETAHVEACEERLAKLTEELATIKGD